MIGAPPKAAENFSVSIVAEVMTILRSRRFCRRLFRIPSTKSMLRLRSCASSTMIVSYSLRKGSAWASMRRMPSVMILMNPSGDVRSSKRIL